MIRLQRMFAAAALAIAWASPATAQHGSHPRLAQLASTYSDAELRSFAGAATQIKRINDTYLPKLQAAATPEKQQEVERTASSEMAQALKHEGMTVEKFHEILMHARANPELAERVRQHLPQPRH